MELRLKCFSCVSSAVFTVSRTVVMLTDVMYRTLFIVAMPPADELGPNDIHYKTIIETDLS